MKKIVEFIVKLSLVGLCIVLLCGCIDKRAPQVSYYSLLSAQQLGTMVGEVSNPEIKLGIGPITIPDSLKRTQLVTRDEQNIYQFTEYHRWAGVLEKDIAAVLGDNLGLLTGVDKVAFFPWMHHFSPNYRVIVDITRFDGDLAGEAVLNARWSIADAKGATYLAGGQSVYRQPLESDDYAALVRAESQLLAELSREIALELQTFLALK
ncbi:MAG: PqiC family protein [Desulfuromonadales bacterium]|nr:PqiC family protein [Desulfuromonadales bacterium]